MIEGHEIFIPPHLKTEKIWRYMDFTKYVDLLNTQSLYFSRSDQFEDVFEGSFPKSAIEKREKVNAIMARKFPNAESFKDDDWSQHGEKQRQDFAINCWHLNEFESAAMWKLYLKSNEGIAVQSTYGRLYDCLDKSSQSFFVGKVNYIDYDKDYFDPFQLINPFIYKRKSFEYEKEIRAVFWQAAPANSEIDLKQGGFKVRVRLQELVEKVYVSPDSPIWLTKLVEEVSLKYHVTAPVINSGIKGIPLF